LGTPQNRDFVPPSPTVHLNGFTEDKVMFGFFGKKIEVEVPDGKGGRRKVRISQKQLDQWIAEGHLSGPKTVCEVHILDALEGDRTVEWIVGEEVDQDTYERFKDRNGDLFVVVVYRKGEPEVSVTAREVWESMKNI